MSDERLPITTFNYKTNQKRKPGRLKKKWMDDIEKAIRDKGLKEEWTLFRKK